MYAHVPVLPGPVTEVADKIAKSDNYELGGDWHACGAIVEAGWLFDGSTFTPPTPK